jgi:hypothetical protein
MSGNNSGPISSISVALRITARSITFSNSRTSLANGIASAAASFPG